MKIILCIFLYLISIANIDAQVYNSRKKYEYDVYHIVNNDTISIDKVYLECTGKKWLNPETGVPIDYSWMITWNFNNKYSETTGVKESYDRLFLHPIRIEKFGVLEFCPFPMAVFPLKEGLKWEHKLENINNIYYKSLNNQKAKCIKEVLSNYLVKEKVTIYNKIPKMDIECYLIEGVGCNNFKKTKSSFLYSLTHGFIYMKFYTINNDVYEFIMNHNHFYNKKQELWY